MPVSPVIFPRELVRICRLAAEAYVLQYKVTTPPEVLQAWVGQDYQPGEWVRARHHRQQGFRFLVRGRRVIGYLRFLEGRGGVEIRKIWIASRYQGMGLASLLTGQLPEGSVGIRIYAGNPRAIRVFRKMGFNLQAHCWFRAKGFVQSGRLLQRSPLRNGQTLDKL